MGRRLGRGLMRASVCSLSLGRKPFTIKLIRRSPRDTGLGALDGLSRDQFCRGGRTQVFWIWYTTGSMEPRECVPFAVHQMRPHFGDAATCTIEPVNGGRQADFMNAQQRTIERYRTFLAVLLLFLVGAPSEAMGMTHEDLRKQIEETSAALTETPDDAGLFLLRGDLHRRHHSWDLAQADLLRAGRLGAEPEGVSLLGARLYRDRGWIQSALFCVDEVLAEQPGHVGALVLRAEILAP